MDVLGTKIPEIGRATITPATPIQLNGIVPETIHIPSRFGGYAVDVTIDNLDAVGTLSFRFNSRIGPTKTISPSGAFTATESKIVLIDIVTGTNWEITINLVPLPKGI